MSAAKTLTNAELSRRTGFSRTFIYAARQGYTDSSGTFRKLEFKANRRGTVKELADWVAKNPEFRVQKALQEKKQRPTRDSSPTSGPYDKYDERLLKCDLPDA